MLRQNAALQGLTDVQLTAIAEMSRNDENTVIGTRIGELHGQYDQDVLSVTGIKKNEGEKSYDYAKRVLGHYKSQLDATKDLQGQLDTANAKIAELNSKIEKGEGDAALRQQLKDAKAQVAQLQEQLTAKDTAFAATKAELEGKIMSAHVDHAFANATAGLKFKEGISESLQGILLKAARAEVLAKGTPDFIDDGKGGKVLVLRGSDGNILNNIKNNLNPYTVSELLMETSLKDAIDTGKVKTGGGTKPDSRDTGNTVLDLTGVKSQMEATKAIETYLLNTGLTRDSAEFSEQSMQLWKENNVSEMPIR